MEKNSKKIDEISKIKKKFFLDAKTYPQFIIKITKSHIVESLYCLERSIFWFFNYKYNMNKTFEIAGVQAEYYSNFFIKLAIQKLLGISMVHTDYIGKVFVKIDWETAIIEILTKGSWSADHKKIANDFFELMKNLNLDDFPQINELFQVTDNSFSKFTGIPTEKLSKDHADYLRKSRMDYVYDFTSRQSDPFNNFYGVTGNYYGNVKKYCFLDGYDKYNDGSEYIATSFIPDVYGSWGINEHFIGSLMKFLTSNLKKIENLKDYFSILIRKIKNSEEFNEEAREIILHWL